jgi:predicted NBD/HSP70 family sugar kinase
VDPWSGDSGVGVEYFSQEAIIKLAKAAKIELEDDLSPASKLKMIQGMMAYGDPKAEEIYQTMGAYLAYGLAYYSLFYKIQVVMILGRVTSGKGGEIMLDVAKGILVDEFPELASTIEIVLPDENNRRVGQSIAAASLPEIKK